MRSQTGSPVTPGLLKPPAIPTGPASWGPSSGKVRYLLSGAECYSPANTATCNMLMLYVCSSPQMLPMWTDKLNNFHFTLVGCSTAARRVSDAVSVVTFFWCLYCSHSFCSQCVSRRCGGGIPPFRQCHLSDSRSAAGARGWGDHAVLWRPASWFLSTENHRLHCSSDLHTSRDLTLHLHACGPGLSTAPCHRLCLCGPGHLSGPHNHGAEGKNGWDTGRARWVHATKISMVWAVATHGAEAFMSPYWWERSIF